MRHSTSAVILAALLILIVVKIAPAHAQLTADAEAAAATLHNNFAGKTFFSIQNDEFSNSISRGFSLSVQNGVTLVRLQTVCAEISSSGVRDRNLPKMTRESIRDCDENRSGLKWEKVVEYAPLQMIVPDSIELKNYGNEYDLISWSYENADPWNAPGFMSLFCIGDTVCSGSVTSLKSLVLGAKKIAADPSFVAPDLAALTPQQEHSEQPKAAGGERSIWDVINADTDKEAEPNLKDEPDVQDQPGRPVKNEEFPAPSNDNVNNGGDNVEACGKVLGTWHWFDNGTVTISADRKATWLEPFTNRQGHTATWQCDVQTGAITLVWTNGFTDVMTAFGAGQNLQGKNNRGMTIWAQRQPNPSASNQVQPTSPTAARKAPAPSSNRTRDPNRNAWKVKR